MRTIAAGFNPQETTSGTRIQEVIKHIQTPLKVAHIDEMASIPFRSGEGLPGSRSIVDATVQNRGDRRGDSKMCGNLSVETIIFIASNPKSERIGAVLLCSYAPQSKAPATMGTLPRYANGSLTQEELRCNRSLSYHRVVIENFFGRLSVLPICCALVNFDMQRSAGGLRADDSVFYRKALMRLIAKGLVR
jgi:hypothetical protein